MKKLYLLFLMACALPLTKASAQFYTQGDISVNIVSNLQHDSTVCGSTGSLYYNLTIANSFVGDSVMIVDETNASQIFVAHNDLGQNPWTIDAPVFFYNPFITDDQLSSNTALFYGPTAKIVCGTDTIYDLNNTYPLTVPNPCTYGQVTGRVYVDYNSNCMFDATDVPLQSLAVSGTVNLNNPSQVIASAYGYTGMAGDYNMTVQQSWMTNYSVYMPSAYQFIFPSVSCSPISYTYTTLPQANVDFALQCTSNVDVQCAAGGAAAVRPTVPFNLYPFVSNTGCDMASGQLTLTLDPHVIYNGANGTGNPPTSVTGNTLVWDYANLTNLSNGAYWNSFFAGVNLVTDGTVNIGDTLCFHVSANVPAGDVNAANNDYSFCLPVVASFDPNEKDVAPKGYGPQGNILPSTDLLTYTIHFQNTGTAAAYNVSVIDTLDANVTASSLKILGNSHNLTPEWLAPGIVKFNFYNIMLPDSGTSQAASQGFVSFSVKLNQGLNIGTQIKNKGYIYFDSNAPVITNTALNTIAWPESVTTLASAKDGITLYPTPAGKTLNVDLVQSSLTNASLSIMDINGREVMQQPITNSHTVLNVGQLPAGMYLLKLTNDNNTTVRNFVKQ